MGYIRIETNGTSADELWYLIGARYYDYEICRWISQDPMMFDAIRGISSYVYCHNNPVNKIDSDGRLVWLSPAVVYLAVRIGQTVALRWQQIPPLAKMGTAAVIAAMAKYGMKEDDAVAFNEALKGIGPEGEVAGVISDVPRQNRTELEKAGAFAKEQIARTDDRLNEYWFPPSNTSKPVVDFSTFDFAAYFNSTNFKSQNITGSQNGNAYSLYGTGYKTLEEIRADAQAQRGRVQVQDDEGTVIYDSKYDD